jgi:hypothetical protein
MGSYDSCVCLRADSRVLWAKSIDDPSQTQIDSTSHECRRNGEAHNLHQESCLRPLILPTLNPANISKDLKNDTCCHSECEGRGTSSEGKGCQICDEGDTEESQKSGVCRQRDAVEIVRARDGTLGSDF